jgi:hypothetical protein
MFRRLGPRLDVIGQGDVDVTPARRWNRAPLWVVRLGSDTVAGASRLR